MKVIPLLMINLYKWCVSPFTAGCCRYYPTCSEYSHQAIKSHGLWHGGILAAKRIASCNPWGGSGVDPVPLKDNQSTDNT